MSIGSLRTCPQLTALNLPAADAGRQAHPGDASGSASCPVKQSQRDGASHWLSAALSHYNETRENCPFSFCQVFKYRDPESRLKEYVDTFLLKDSIIKNLYSNGSHDL